MLTIADTLKNTPLSQAIEKFSTAPQAPPENWFGDYMCVDGWFIKKKAFGGYDAFRATDIVWVYPEKYGSTSLFMKSISWIIIMKVKPDREIRLGRESNIQAGVFQRDSEMSTSLTNSLNRLKPILPWAAFGYSETLKNSWDKNRSLLFSNQDKEIAKIRAETAETAKIDIGSSIEDTELAKKDVKLTKENHLMLLQKGVDAWNQWRQENPSNVPSLSLVNLCEAKLGGANLSGANLLGAQLVGAHLEEASLEKAVLAAARLEEAHLEKANLEGAYLEEAHLEKANLSGANLGKALFIRANLCGANLIQADLSGASLFHANLGGANLSGANLSAVLLSGANLEGANLSGANLSGAILSGANLRRANLKGAKLEGTSLRGTIR